MKHTFDVYIKVINRKEIFNLPAGIAHFQAINKKEDLYIPFIDYVDIDFKTQKAYIIYIDTKRLSKIRYICGYISRELGITPEQMKSKSRLGEIVFARYLFFYGMRKLTTLSLNSIGKELDRDHSTAIYGINEIRSILEYDKGWRKTEVDKFIKEML